MATSTHQPDQLEFSQQYIIKPNSGQPSAHIYHPDDGILCNVKWWRWSGYHRYEPEIIIAGKHRFCEDCKLKAAKRHKQIFKSVFPDTLPREVIAKHRVSDGEGSPNVEPGPSKGVIEVSLGEKNTLRCKCNRIFRIRRKESIFGPVLEEETECPNCSTIYPVGMPLGYEMK